MANYCPKCGSRVDASDRFCAECGARFSPGAQGDLVTCRRCKGTGKAREYNAILWGDPENKCPACNGTGWVRV